MRLVLLSGGSGKRLWPLSNESRSKQFLKILDNNNNEKESMLQRVWGQISRVGLSNSTVIATSKVQKDMISNQIGENVPIILEPERRDTFPAIVLASLYLYSIQKISSEETIVVLPVDPFVEANFFEKIKCLESVLDDSKADLALMGVKPTNPSTKFGYIIPSEEIKEKDYFYVDRFTEKPDKKIAEELIRKNALWNCGVFAFKLKYLLSILLEKKLPTDYSGLLSIYNELPKISFDYEVVERANKIVALPYDGYWKDLGTWNSLTEEMRTNQIGYGEISSDTTNTHLINELDIPVMILSQSNTIVVASPDGILVSDKNQSPRIKELVGNLENRPMFEERRWGWYRILDLTKYDDGNEVLTRRIVVSAGKHISYQYHNKRSEFWTILKGEGQFVLNGKMNKIHTGDVLRINPGELHAIKAITNLEFIEVQSGSELIEEDVIRLHTEWHEIEEVCSLLAK